MVNLQFYVDAWAESMRAVLGLELDESQGHLRTALPDWAVHDVIAHLVHLEEALASGADEALAADKEQAPANKEPAPRRTAITSDYTEAGVEKLRGVPLAELLDRLSIAVRARAEQLSTLPPDPLAPAERVPAGVAWDWETLLRNRAIDAWMHEQDIRRAIGKPGGLDTKGAQLCVHTFAAALPYVVGKRAGVPIGHTVSFEIQGSVPLMRTIVMAESGRAELIDANSAETASTGTASLTVIAMDSETFARLAGGREPLDAFEVRITGNSEIADRVLEHLAITP